ncbi:unnamed protein product [Euphydryas editha]|uniref:Uncharacterized protein n=1 Tax=Euphydryas editha TaxID=104508 RepID=A0AAU9UW78_EUPED|nr:unnamed protein product [Euphydryas editha]
MSYLLYFTIILIHFTNSLATRIPLKCLFGDHNFLNIFDTDAVTASTNEGPTTNSLQFGVVKFDSHKVDKDGWILKLKNIEFKGMDDAILDDFSINFVTNVFRIAFHTDFLVTYDYKTNGYLFSKPIFGEGLLISSLENIQIRMSIPFDFKEINSKKLMILRNFDLGYYIRNKAVLNFLNLYNGDKKLMLGKILKKILVLRPPYHLTPSFSTLQFGFIPQRSVEDAPYALVEEI